jgi:hypothetical protein
MKTAKQKLEDSEYTIREMRRVLQEIEDEAKRGAGSLFVAESRLRMCAAYASNAKKIGE